jgi:16S rRNA C967 or C1407 C5-methylase (RsmB/RsmF family)
MERHREFAMKPVQIETLTGPYLALSPRRHGTDGFFAAVLEREAASAATN